MYTRTDTFLPTKSSGTDFSVMDKVQVAACSSGLHGVSVLVMSVRVSGTGTSGPPSIWKEKLIYTY